jgi:hypothetical protein
MRYWFILAGLGIALYPVISSGGLLDQWLGPFVALLTLLGVGFVISEIAARGTWLLAFGALFFVMLAGSVADDRLSTIRAKAMPILVEQCRTLPEHLKAGYCPSWLSASSSAQTFR